MSTTDVLGSTNARLFTPELRELAPETPDKWMVRVGFDADGAVAASMVTPSPPPSIAAVNSVTIPFASPFTSGSVTFTRDSKTVLVSGTITRSSGFSASFTQCLASAIPVGLRPASANVLPASVAFGATVLFQFAFNPDGTVQLRQSAASGLGMSPVGVSYASNDPSL